MKTEESERDEMLRSWLKAEISTTDHAFENSVMSKLIQLSSQKEKRRKIANKINNFIIIGFCLLTVIVFGLSCADKTVFIYFKISFDDWMAVSDHEDPYERYHLMLMTTAILSVIFLMLHWILVKKKHGYSV